VPGKAESAVTTRKSSLAVNTTAVGGDSEVRTTVVSTTGTLDIATADAFESAVMAALEQGEPVVIDVAGLTLCDSTGLGAIVRLHRRAQTMKRELALRDPRPHIADLLAMTGIDKVIPVTTSHAPAD
jgi:anti-sigma B factor antagonist